MGVTAVIKIDSQGLHVAITVRHNENWTSLLILVYTPWLNAMDALAYTCLKILQFVPFCLELLIFFVNFVLAICFKFIK